MFVYKEQSEQVFFSYTKDHGIKMPYAMKIWAGQNRQWARNAEYRRQVAPHR